MEWQDEGIVLSVRPHGETSAIAELLTTTHGRHLGLVHGGRSRKNRPVLQPGNRVCLHWRARLADHLGSFNLELESGRAAFIMEHRTSLLLLGHITELMRLLPEREPHPVIYTALDIITTALAENHEPDALALLLVRFELGLLEEFGFGLDLSRCAATGQVDELIYVSPKSGRAVCASAGEPYKDKLLKLPSYLNLDKTSQHEEPHPSDFKALSLAALNDGLRLTGYFLEKYLLFPQGRRLTDARVQFSQLFK